jgi:hypothetical protein
MIIEKLDELKSLDYPIVILEKKERVLDIAKMSDKIFKDRGLCLCINVGWSGQQKIIKSSIKEIIQILENNTIDDVFGIGEPNPVVTLVFGSFTNRIK